jgi:hypothetical protein
VADHLPHRTELRLPLLLGLRLRLELFQAEPRLPDARLELVLLDQPLAIGVDQLADLTLHPAGLHLQLVPARRLVCLIADVQTALIFFLDAPRLRQQR